MPLYEIAWAVCTTTICKSNEFDLILWGETQTQMYWAPGCGVSLCKRNTWIGDPPSSRYRPIIVGFLIRSAPRAYIIHCSCYMRLTWSKGETFHGNISTVHITKQTKNQMIKPHGEWTSHVTNDVMLLLIARVPFPLLPTRTAAHDGAYLHNCPHPSRLNCSPDWRTAWSCVAHTIVTWPSYK